MACLVSVSFSTPLSFCSRNTLLEEIHGGRSSSRRIVCPPNSKAAIKVVATKCSDRGRFSINKSCHHCFWVGPDIDDGWGFVDALVTQIF